MNHLPPPMQVLVTFATSLPDWSLTSHSKYPKVLPAFIGLAYWSSARHAARPAAA